MRKNKNYNKSLMKNIILSGYLLSNFTGGVVSLQASAPESGQPSINLATDELGRLILDRAAEVGKFSSWKILDEDAFINKVKELIRRGANMDEVRAWLTTSGPRKTQAIVGQLLARIDAADILRFEAPPPPQPLPASPPSARQPESGASGYSTFAPRQPDRPTDDRLTNALFSLTLDCALEGMNSEFRNEGWDLIERGADIERVRALFGDFDPVVRATAMRLLEEAEATRSTRSRASAPPPPAPRRP
ncbi:MAG: hypothetical protein LBJ81_00275, partial [Puniceicoccales bacterium]|nr:hypothetical protein [Puniceicoccales bacterium]